VHIGAATAAQVVPQVQAGVSGRDNNADRRQGIAALEILYQGEQTFARTGVQRLCDECHRSPFSLVRLAKAAPALLCQNRTNKKDHLNGSLQNRIRLITMGGGPRTAPLRISVNIWTEVVPLGVLFKCMPDSAQQRLRQVLSHELEAEGQPVSVLATG